MSWRDHLSEDERLFLEPTYHTRWGRQSRFNWSQLSLHTKLADMIEAALAHRPTALSLTEDDKSEIELARFYKVHIRTGSFEHVRLILIADLANILDLATGNGLPDAIREGSSDRPDSQNS